MITQEQYDRLVKYEKNLYTAYYLDFLRNLGQTAINELDIIYEDIFQRKSKLKGGCSYCVLQEVKLLAREFYTYQTPKQEDKTNGQTDNKKKKEKKSKNGNRQ